MSNWISQASLSPLEGFSDGTKAYGLLSPQFINKYFIISSPGTSRLMAYPEVTGFGSYLALLPATTAVGELRELLNTEEKKKIHFYLMDESSEKDVILSDLEKDEKYKPNLDNKINLTDEEVIFHSN